MQQPVQPFKLLCAQGPMLQGARLCLKESQTFPNKQTQAYHEAYHKPLRPDTMLDTWGLTDICMPRPSWRHLQQKRPACCFVLVSDNILDPCPMHGWIVLTENVCCHPQRMVRRTFCWIHLLFRQTSAWRFRISCSIRCCELLDGMSGRCHL